VGQDLHRSAATRKLHGLGNHPVDVTVVQKRPRLLDPTLLNALRPTRAVFGDGSQHAEGVRPIYHLDKPLFGSGTRVNGRSITITLAPIGNRNEKEAVERLLKSVNRWKLTLPCNPKRRQLRSRSNIS
jgi:hypothetical protein